MQRILTPRELEIALLVASGKPNRRIAAELFLSLRTVENHLYAVYAKLGIRSRTELALAVFREGLPLSQAI